MWADTFLRAEQQHVLLSLLWAASSVLSATVIAIILAAQHRSSPLLAQFATQLALWGLVLAAVAGIEWHGVHVRDAASAIRIERLMWMRVGFDAGIAGMGAVLVFAGRLAARSARASGAGMAIVMHGLALFAIDSRFTSSISR